MCPLNSKDLQRIFEKLDKNGDGLLSLEELNWLLDRIGVSLSLEDLESSVGNSSLNFDEFLAFYESIAKRKEEDKEIIEEEEEEEAEEEDLFNAFKVFDENGDGFISSEELQSVLQRLGLWDGKDCRYMIRVYDTNCDGFVDFQEFKSMMLQSPSS